VHTPVILFDTQKLRKTSVRAFGSIPQQIPEPLAPGISRCRMLATTNHFSISKRTNAPDIGFSNFATASLAFDKCIEFSKLFIS